MPKIIDEQVDYLVIKNPKKLQKYGFKIDRTSLFDDH